jgi:hypothetical protein
MFKILFWLIILANYAAINLSVVDGFHQGDISLRFQERQAITFISALQLALTAMTAFFTYIIGRILYKSNMERLRDIRIWLISFFVFVFCTADEYFMLHEGVDSSVAKAFFGITKNPHMDGLALMIYGAIALVLFYKFKNEIFRYRQALWLFAVGGVFFAMTTVLDLNSVDQFKIIVEETAKLIAVAFIFLGHIKILIENVNILDHRFNP